MNEVFRKIFESMDAEVSGQIRKYVTMMSVVCTTPSVLKVVSYRVEHKVCGRVLVVKPLRKELLEKPRIRRR
jgi:hypothetical protein